MLYEVHLTLIEIRTHNISDDRHKLVLTKHFWYSQCLKIGRQNNWKVLIETFILIVTLLTLSEHMSSHFLPCQSTWVHTSYPVRSHKFTLRTLSEHLSSHFLLCQSTWFHTSYPVTAHEFTLLTLSEHMRSHILPCLSTWVHTSYPVRAHEFTLLSLSEHMSSHFLPCQST